MEKVILAESFYKRKLPPLSLMKISTYHKEKGDEVIYHVGNPTFLDFNATKIYISTLFTWNVNKDIELILQYKRKYPNAEIIVGGVCATVMHELIKEKTGIETFKGLWEEIDNYKPDYSLFPNLKYSISYTTRGCPNKCSFCFVKNIEPEFIEIENWEKDIDTSKEKILLYDNNFLASSDKHFNSVIDKLKKLKMKVDFNQGLDCRLLTDERARRLAEIKIDPVRFAFDGLHQDNYIHKAIITMKSYGKKDIVVYVLWNFNDTPEDFYYRLKELVKLEVASFPMEYRPPEPIKNIYIGKHWTKTRIDNVRFIFDFDSVISGRGILGRETKIDTFEKNFGKNEKEFVERLDSNFFINNKEFKRKVNSSFNKIRIKELKKKHLTFDNFFTD